jgi:glycosyltransferase involved in cell wall biosynthesis
MRIALLIDTLDGGGAERVVQLLATGLARRGHQTFVYCLKTAARSVSHLAAAGVVVREARSRGRDPLLTGRLACWLWHDRVELAHLHSSAAVVCGLPAARLLGIATVHVRHGALLGRPSKYQRLADRLDACADEVVIVSESQRRGLPTPRLARRAVHVPNGRDLAPVAPTEARTLLERHVGRPLAGPVVVSVGTICPEKDICGLLRAFALVQRCQSTAALVCVGQARGDDYARAVLAECRRLGLEEQVWFPGPMDEAWRLMAGADVFCLSSTTEAMPMVIIEAMSQGVPIVATAVGDVGCLDGGDSAGRYALLRHHDNALLVSPGDPSALAEALLHTLGDRAVARTRARRAAADYARHFTTDQMVTRYEQLGMARRVRGSRTGRVGDSRRSWRSGVIMIGPAPESIGGMAAVIDNLLASPLRRRFRLERFWHPDAGAQRRRAAGGSGQVLRVVRAAVRHGRALGQLAGRICRTRADVVHIHTCSFFSFYRSLLDLLVARLLRRRVCLHIHGGRFAEFCAAAGRSGQWLIRHGCQAADAVIVLSQRWRQTLQPFLGSSRIEVVPNGVASAVSHADRRPARACHFLFLGALRRRKGLAELIEAAATLRDADVAYELTIAGPDEASERHDWRSDVQDRGLQAHVRFIGPVRGAAKQALLAAADCLVLPSHSEGLPLVLLEAAAADLAVIATSVGSIPEFVAAVPSSGSSRGANLAPLVAPGDAAGLAREMDRLARDAELRRRIGRALGAHVRARYGMAQIARQLGDLYDELLSRRRPCRQAQPAVAPRRSLAGPAVSAAQPELVGAAGQ